MCRHSFSTWRLFFKDVNLLSFLFFFLDFNAQISSIFIERGVVCVFFPRFSKSGA